MDQHHQKQMKSLQDRIAKVEAQIQNANAMKAEASNIQLSKKDKVQRSNIVMERKPLKPSHPVTNPSPSQDKLPRLMENGSRF
ncbi:hypothetical protein TRFO_30497 [Tritrichomonas foetus]|uniref:Uncharacterized protein n=1 Tax=Tritrichomonas foetus TaxID=1144522 RepID=A0A1J4JY45_9EUKA|nr:hypothetical protein TRFO_30497 [Tritrichomonas foetus]|eukprot:OHT02430.1 hypothetical protein TRFO_30497 [Tritrichomonas foetus]